MYFASPTLQLAVSLPFAQDYQIIYF